MEIFKLDSPQLKEVPKKPDDGINRPFMVSAIKPALKTENRANIFINGKFDFSLEISQVVDLGLKVGKWLSVPDLNECRHASEFGKLYHHALEYTLTRPHSVKEVRDHLVRRRFRREQYNKQAVKNRTKPQEEILKYNLPLKELPLYTNEDIEQAIAKLQEKHYLDDANFAKWFAENRSYKKGVSPKRLRQELMLKGVSQDIIDISLEQNGRDEEEEIKKVVARKAKKYTPEKLIAYLVRQGFDYQLSKAVVHGMDSQS